MPLIISYLLLHQKDQEHCSFHLKRFSEGFLKIFMSGLQGAVDVYSSVLLSLFTNQN